MWPPLPFPGRPLQAAGRGKRVRVQSADRAVRRGRTPLNALVALLPAGCCNAAAAAPAGRPGGAPPCGGESPGLLAQRAARVSVGGTRARRGGEWRLRKLPVGRRMLHGLRYFLFNNSDLWATISECFKPGGAGQVGSFLPAVPFVSAAFVCEEVRRPLPAPPAPLPGSRPTGSRIPAGSTPTRTSGPFYEELNTKQPWGGWRGGGNGAAA